MYIFLSTIQQLATKDPKISYSQQKIKQTKKKQQLATKHSKFSYSQKTKQKKAIIVEEGFEFTTNYTQSDDKDI